MFRPIDGGVLWKPLPGEELAPRQRHLRFLTLYADESKAVTITAPSMRQAVRQAAQASAQAHDGAALAIRPRAGRSYDLVPIMSREHGSLAPAMLNHGQEIGLREMHADVKAVVWGKTPNWFDLRKAKFGFVDAPASRRVFDGLETAARAASPAIVAPVVKPLATTVTRPRLGGASKAAIAAIAVAAAVTGAVLIANR